MGNAGLFYYYHTFAKALDAMGMKTLVDEDGKEHDWRAELVAELAQRQRPDGSWINDNDRWLEGDANLVTGYALLALRIAADRRATVATGFQPVLELFLNRKPLPDRQDACPHYLACDYVSPSAGPWPIRESCQPAC